LLRYPRCIRADIEGGLTGLFVYPHTRLDGAAHGPHRHDLHGRSRIKTTKTGSTDSDAGNHEPVHQFSRVEVAGCGGSQPFPLTSQSYRQEHQRESTSALVEAGVAREVCRCITTWGDDAPPKMTLHLRLNAARASWTPWHGVAFIQPAVHKPGGAMSVAHWQHQPHAVPRASLSWIHLSPRSDYQAHSVRAGMTWRGLRMETGDESGTVTIPT